MANTLEYGRKISLKEANEIIKEHEYLADQVELKKTIKANEADSEKLAEFLKRKTNAFIFSRDLIDRFFNNDAKAAEYLVVLLGAHPDSTASGDHGKFPPGSFTVVTAGCVAEKNGEDINLRTLPIAHPANEYPPKKLMYVLQPKEAYADGTVAFSIH